MESNTKPKNACEWAIALQNAQQPVWRDLDTWRRLDPDCTYAIAAALLRERDEARAIIAEQLDHSADGVLLCRHDGPLYCPVCSGEVEQTFDLCYCWNCGNPDSYGEPPLPLAYYSTFASPEQH